MRLLLINNNPAVSRLINLSAEKYGYEIEEFKNDDFDLNKDYDITITDNEAVNENSILLLKESGNLGEIIYVGPKGLPKPSYAEYFLQKPFLPTDFIDLIKKIEELKKKKETAPTEDDSLSDEEYEDIENIEEESIVALDLDDMDSLDLPMSDDNFFEHEDKKAEEESNNEELEPKETEEDSDGEEIESEMEVDDLLGDDILVEDVVESLEDKKDVPEELKLDEDESFEESDTAILDSEDIDEVKQLLDEDIAPKETEELDDVKSDEAAEEIISVEDEDTQDDMDAVLSETNIEEVMDDIDTQDEILDDLIQESEELQQPEDILKEIDDIDSQSDLEDVVEIEETDEIVETDKTDEIELNKDVKKSENTTIVSNAEKLSIDDLLEEDFSELFEFESTNREDENSRVDIGEIKEELQTKIVSDVKKALDKDGIREALKGLKVNISISFDEE